MKSNLFKRIYKRFEHYFPTAEERDPCSSCGGCMRHLLHQDNGMSAEAKFGCLTCGKTEFRGGFGSENWLKEIYFARRKSPYLRKKYSIVIK